MSGVVKGIKKVFKKVVKVVKKIAKPLMIAAAVYFTGGLALSAFGPTQAFAASLPGFGISSSGAATGIFSKAASAMGLSGGLEAGAAASAAGTAGAASATKIGAAAAKGGSAAASASTASTVAKVGAAAAKGGAAASTAATGLSLTEKLLLAQMGTKAVGAFLSPSTDEVIEAQRKWRGAFYGFNADGSRDLMPQEQASTPTQPAVPREASREPARPAREPGGVTLPAQPATPQPQVAQRDLMAPEPAQPRQQSTQQPVSNEPINLKKPQAPGVRYV